MTRFFPRLTPAARIAVGLTSLVVTILLAVDIVLNLVPDQTDMLRKVRESTSERLAVQITSLIQANQWDALKATMGESIARDKDILSLAVRREDGRVVIEAGDHLHHWQAPAGGRSTLTDVRVPILDKDVHWGDVEISYRPVTPQTLMDWLRMPVVAIGLIVVPVGFLAFYLYMRRSLQYLDPTAAIPDRVRTAFDALTEGVTVIDKAGRIMMYNKAFRHLHPYASEDMIGKPLSGLAWLKSGGNATEIPWENAMRTQANVNGRLLTFTRPDQSEVRVVVNAAPIQDARGKLRGGIVTFYDVTELHRANEQMQTAMAALEASRAHIEEKNEELTRLATRDSLTGCLNRRAFYSMAEALFDKLKHEARNMSCIMFDIDFFKNVNDTYGHLVGDQVIVAVARALTLHMRGSDLLCRYGGEEFCIMLPGAPEEIAMDVAERLRHEVQQHVGEGLRSVKDLRVTGSVGVASLKSGAESVSELIELADFALYHSKRNGRNRVTLWSENMAEETDNSTPPGVAPSAASEYSGPVAKSAAATSSIRSID
jgi:diguanylate cyclase (GGDEF)-like protein/PAS domain S-box-containing protein